MTPRNTQVTLASKSSARQMILKNAGVAFEAVSPGVDEDAAKAGLLAEEVTPRDIADALARTPGTSIGRASCFGDAADIARLHAAADTDLYAVKHKRSP